MAEALFDEWAAGLRQYRSASLRRESQTKIEPTRCQYNQLIAAMTQAETKIDPVLDAFRDQDLHLEHNLNAQAIASLPNELDAIETAIGGLIRDMEKSIAEADKFLATMVGEGT